LAIEYPPLPTRVVNSHYTLHTEKYNNIEPIIINKLNSTADFYILVIDYFTIKIALLSSNEDLNYE